MTEPTRAAAITLAGVSKWFGSAQVLDGIDLVVGEGERVVICGPSGSGKSTLLRCINGLEDHQQGRVEVDGIVLDGTPQANLQVRRRVGMVFQQFNLFPHLSVLENCTLAPVHAGGVSREEARQRALALLDRVHVGDQADKYPAQLSGGQQQRVAIARALCMVPRIMLFDEPTSALDPEMIKEVLDVILDLADEGMTMVCVTHEMGFARRLAHRMVFMDEGRIIETAPPDRFFDRPAEPRTREFLSRLFY